ncbi:dephospho-CoA kinase [Anaerosinus massiliensis]|uniref:dephospho-CoA kinase n=1 Tax=Massilibacillus massiliensis TaxID=1806837 RepID=UPI000B02F0AF|nr:dephospho-CoA kinase [Massilibacillus massiliensis]
MYLIGLTGGIASGKSTVSQMLKNLGGKIIDADKIAREVVMPNEPAWQDIIKKFGKEILLEDQNLDRIKLGNLIFSNQDAKKHLDFIMHPRIEEKIKQKILQYRDDHDLILVLDIPLLYEAGWDTITNENWVVYVSPTLQLERLMKRNKLTKQQAIDRVNSQMLLEDKAKLADYIIDNNGSLEDTKNQIIKRWNDIKSEWKKR